MNIKYILTSIFLLTNITLVEAQLRPIDTRWEQYISLEKYLKPFWSADTLYDEMVLPVTEDGQTSGTLLFKASKILSVRSSDHQTEFKKGTDWSYSKGRLLIKPNSTMPFLKEEELVFTLEKPNLSMRGKKNGTFVLFSETPYFPSHQVAVTYIRAKNEKWEGIRPIYAGENLPLSIKKLQSGDAYKVVFYGNSIEVGYNASSFLNCAPYLPTWPELIIYGLRKRYASPIDFANPSVAGMMAAWGNENATKLVSAQSPDLVIIGFGMNDGSSNIDPAEYRKQIAGIISKVSAEKKDAEFILISPMLANPFAVQNGIQDKYKVELDKLARTGVVVADITSVHKQLLLRKRYQDMTGNNVNHPNDYLIRWYAQFILSLMIK